MDAASERRAGQGETMGEGQEDLVRLLPDDALADALRRLPRRGLAVSRCVRRAWRDFIDARRLMLPHLLPCAVGGIFININFNGLDSSVFLARPTATGPAVSGDFDYLPGPSKGSSLRDHCNGLLLLRDAVANPATRRWAPLAPRPPPRMSGKYFYEDEYLVYDPAVSPHFEHVLNVFSSETGQWEERLFLREGKAAGTIAEMRSACLLVQKRYAAYWKGEIYVGCEADFVMRVSLANKTYQVIEPPVHIKVPMFQGLHLGRSEKGVYCAVADFSLLWYELRVWILEERPHNQMEWVLKHEAKLYSLRASQQYNRQTKGPWIFQDINYYHRAERYNVDAAEQAKLEWDSDDDNVLQIGDTGSKLCGSMDLLGFHPYEEVIFFCESKERGFAYHLNSSKVQDLGNLYPRNYRRISGYHREIRGSVPYTPCWIEDFPINN
ncbi:hypothetical protein C2845_PM11G00470 [Panicum miliaceum]|uniref:F-box domain-containing protein n=1 Tax=Panicum miliaceum TaxID=4540 RepID=A0A3L6RT20_PANMI|nr:hypothetical protein C2845_PM11G00470 [Panicum miliaceum]